jgi:gamma-glutamyltranspeptidase/glutathione hydrolase
VGAWRDRLRGIVFVASALATVSALAQHAPDRAAVASAHPLASEAGIEVLAAGGNAFDAAIAVSASLSVVEPFGSGIGGGALFLLQPAGDGQAVMVDAREKAPGAAHRDMYLDATGEPIPRASRDGALAAGIPGLPAALVHLAEHYGELPLARSLAPAIRQARDGFPAYAGLLRRIESRSRSMNAAAREAFMPGGQLPTAGEVLRQPDLAATLQALADQGHGGFYGGRVAEQLVAGVRAGGGIWSTEDLAGYSVIERPAVTGRYRGAEIVSAAPPSSGGVALINMLNMLDGFDVASLDRVGRVHLLTEVMRRAYRDRAVYLGDADFVDVPVARLTHPYYASGQSATIRLDRATPSDALPGVSLPPAGPGDQTSHFSVLDARGNAVAATQSINFSFGSGFMPAETGVILNNEMDDFSIKPGVPNGYGLIGAEANAIAPHKRMLSSMTPTILKSERGIALLGTPGGSRIITMVFLASLAWIEGGDAAAMVAVPRFHHQYVPDVIEYERGALDAATVADLERLGHALREVGRDYGDMHVVTWDTATGAVDAASDPRGIGEVRYTTR